MAAVLWVFLIIALVLSADFLWASYRDWRARQLARKHGRTLTAKFSLPPS